MPHLHLETTADLNENGDVPDILEALVEALQGIESISGKGLRACHSLRSVWVMGEGAEPGFAHCTLSILTGRSPELRRMLAEAMMQVLRRSFVYSLEQNEIVITVEVREMERDTYLTHRSG